MDEYQQSIVAQWNEIALGSVREGGGGPTKVAWSLTAVHTAIFDAWAAFDPNAVGVHSRLDDLAGPATEAAKAEAVSYAAFTALSEVYPDSARVAEYRAFMVQNGFDPDASPTDPGSPAAIGIAAAEAVIAQRATDRSNYENDFADTSGFVPVNAADPASGKTPGGDLFDPNFWQPLRVPTGTEVDANGNPIVTDDPASYKDQVGITPHWGDVKSFSLVENDMLRPTAPPLLGDFTEYTDGMGKVTTGDAAYREQLETLIHISANLTPEHKLNAEYWADGPRTEQPPGHWNQLAQDIAKRDLNMLDDDVKMFFALNNAIYDAGVATWEAKYVFNYVRPQSGIRDLYFDEQIASFSGANQGVKIISGSEWIPYQSSTFVTPPFPEYVSGHSTFSRVAADTLTFFTGTDSFYDGVSVSNYDLNGDGELDMLGEFVGLELSFEDYEGSPIQLRWETLGEAADDAADSRRFGGIHIQDGDLAGRKLAVELAPLTWAQSQAYFNGTDDALLRADTATEMNDLVQGSFGDDTLPGLGGDDVFRPGTGNDAVDGGAGFDTVQYASGDMSFSLAADRSIMVTRGSETDTLLNIEAVEVGDAVYRTDFGMGETTGMVSRLYHQGLGRDGDAPGISFWIEAVDAGIDPLALAEAFLTSDEYIAANGANETNLAFVEGQYGNLRGGTGDGVGITFWTGILDDDTLTKEQVLIAFAESGESVDHFYAAHADDGAFLLV